MEFHTKPFNCLEPNPDTAQTVVMTNEGGLIDSLIAAGYGDTTVYNVLEMLAPLSGGVITNELLQKIKGNNDYFPEVLVQPLRLLAVAIILFVSVQMAN